MSDDEKRMLLAQAAELAALGMTVERARGRLRRLTENGVSFSDPQIRRALDSFTAADDKWRKLEAEHIALRKKLGLE